jgi:hypothetical protein
MVGDGPDIEPIPETAAGNPTATGACLTRGSSASRMDGIQWHLFLWRRYTFD